MYRPLWIEIDLSALRKNFFKVKKLVGPQVKVMAVLKQEGYGHGLLPLARELSFAGVDYFGLGDLAEAISLRKSGLKEPILILSSVIGECAKEFIDYNITPTVVDLKFAKALNKEAHKKKKTIPVHVKIDTGMGRLGLWHKESLSFVKKLAGCKNLYLEGLYTHFPSADSDTRFTSSQITIFNKLVDELKQEGISFPYLHCANSIGVVNYRRGHFNLIRPGLILYGIKPTPLNISLAPVLSLKSKVIFIKKVTKGRSISYGRTFITKRPGVIATVAVGYADGYPWNLSGRSKVIIRNKLFNIAGRVCMDYIMVDLGRHSNIKLGDEVILIGKSKSLAINTETLAAWARTIPYEIVSRLSLKIPRTYKHSLVK